jgi:phosphoheptose isomerase
MCSNGAELTAFGNDYGFRNIYIPYIEAFRDFMPSFLLLSTSGKSSNIVNAIHTILNSYDHKNIVLLTGGNDNDFDNNPDVKIIRIPSFNTQEIQEAHMAILHRLASDIKNSLVKKEQ